MTDAHWFAIRVVLAMFGGAIGFSSYLYAMAYMKGDDGAFVIVVGFLVGFTFFIPIMLWGGAP